MPAAAAAAAGVQTSNAKLQTPNSKLQTERIITCDAMRCDAMRVTEEVTLCSVVRVLSG